jgi:lysophospholipase L1-like esterase
MPQTRNEFRFNSVGSNLSRHRAGPIGSTAFALLLAGFHASCHKLSRTIHHSKLYSTWGELRCFRSQSGDPKRGWGGGLPPPPPPLRVTFETTRVLFNRSLFLPDMSYRPNNLTTSLRRVTFGLAVPVAGFVPAMQVLVDHASPTLTKPVLVGLVVAAGICGLCILPTRWHKRLLFASIIGLVTLGLTELACSAVSRAAEASIYEWDDRCLYRLRPNSKKTFRRTALNGGERIPVSINSRGFRGPELKPDAAHSDSHRQRILVLGDSFIEAEYSKWEDTFTERLSLELSARTQSRTETINGGVIGYGPDQMLLRLEDEVPRLKPEMVVVCFFADNDLGDLLRNKLFRLDEQGDLQPHAWKLAPDCRHPGSRGPYEPTLWKWTRSAIRGLQAQQSATGSYMDRWLQECTDEYNDYIMQGDPLVRDLQVDHYDADVSLTPHSDSARYKAKLFRKILERMDSVCRTNSTKLLVVIIPSPADLIDDYDFCAIDRQKYPEYVPQAITEVMAHAAKELRIPYINLFDQFQATNPKELYFRGGDNHWNDLGQQTAAKAVAHKIEQLSGQ